MDARPAPAAYFSRIRWAPRTGGSDRRASSSIPQKSFRRSRLWATSAPPQIGRHAGAGRARRDGFEDGDRGRASRDRKRFRLRHARPRVERGGFGMKPDFPFESQLSRDQRAPPPLYRRGEGPGARLSSRQSDVVFLLAAAAPGARSAVPGDRARSPGLRPFRQASGLRVPASRITSHNTTRLLDHLGIEGVTFCVHDWGGAIGMGYAVARPERVQALRAFQHRGFHLAGHAASAFALPRSRLRQARHPGPQRVRLGRHVDGDREGTRVPRCAGNTCDRTTRSATASRPTASFRTFLSRRATRAGGRSGRSRTGSPSSATGR